MKYELIIFDFDGTIADTFHFFLSIVNDVAEKYKFNKLKNGDDEVLRGLKTVEILKYLNVSMWKI